VIKLTAEANDIKVISVNHKMRGKQGKNNQPYLKRSVTTLTLHSDRSLHHLMSSAVSSRLPLAIMLIKRWFIGERVFSLNTYTTVIW
jgi:hypothetical protein